MRDSINVRWTLFDNSKYEYDSHLVPLSTGDSFHLPHGLFADDSSQLLWVANREKGTVSQRKTAEWRM